PRPLRACLVSIWSKGKRVGMIIVQGVSRSESELLRFNGTLTRAHVKHFPGMSKHCGSGLEMVHEKPSGALSSISHTSNCRRFNSIIGNCFPHRLGKAQIGGFGCVYRQRISSRNNCYVKVRFVYWCCQRGRGRGVIEYGLASFW